MKWSFLLVLLMGCYAVPEVRHEIPIPKAPVIVSPPKPEPDEWQMKRDQWQRLHVAIESLTKEYNELKNSLAQQPDEDKLRRHARELVSVQHQLEVLINEANAVYHRIVVLEFQKKDHDRRKIVEQAIEKKLPQENSLAADAEAENIVKKAKDDARRAIERQELQRKEAQRLLAAQRLRQEELQRQEDLRRREAQQLLAIQKLRQEELRRAEEQKLRHIDDGNWTHYEGPETQKIPEPQPAEWGKQEPPSPVFYCMKTRNFWSMRLESLMTVAPKNPIYQNEATGQFYTFQHVSVFIDLQGKTWGLKPTRNDGPLCSNHISQSELH